MRGKALAVAAAGLASCAFACNLIVDTSGLSGGDAGADTGALPTTDAGDAAGAVADATIDRENGSPDASAPETGNLPDAAPLDSSVGFCLAHAGPKLLFCEDWDPDAMDEAGYDLSITGNGSAQPDSLAHSPPRSLLTSYPKISAQVSISVSGQLPTLTPPYTLHLQYALRVSQLPSQAELGGVFRGGYGAYVSIFGGTFNVVESIDQGGGAMDYPGTTGIVAAKTDGSWQEIDLFIKVPIAGEATFGLLIDGVPSVTERKCDSRANALLLNKDSYFLYGMTAGHPSDPWTGRFDDLLIRYE